jgi:sec-independent protein translocase protein TatA
MGGWDAPWHWVVIAILVIALFGYKKLPDAARSLGRSLRIFKTEIKGMTEDDKARAAAKEEPAPAPRALPRAEVVRNDAPPAAASQPEPASPAAPPKRPRPTPSPNSRARAGSNTD